MIPHSLRFAVILLKFIHQKSEDFKLFIS
jgi:hypothetical protein